MRAIGQLGNKYPTIRILARETARKLGPREQEGAWQPERPLHVWSRTLKATTAQSMKLSHRNSSWGKGNQRIGKIDIPKKESEDKVQLTSDPNPRTSECGRKESTSHVKNHGEQEIRKFKRPHQYVWEYRWDNVTRRPQVSSSDTNDAAQQGGCRMFRKECGLKNYIQ